MEQSRLFKNDYFEAYADDFDYFSTPDWATKALVDVLPESPGGWILLEPAAGVGSLLRTLLTELDIKVAVACELYEPRFLQLEADFGSSVRCFKADFLESTEVADTWRAACAGYPNARPLICGNPPYSKPRKGIGMEFAVRCCELAEQLPNTVNAQLLPLDFACGVDRSEQIHDRWPSSLYPFRRRPSFNNDGSGQRPFSWFVWDMAPDAPPPTWKVIG